MLISTRGRYALRVMIELAEHPGEGFLPLKLLSERQGISEKYLESIIRLLVREGLLTGLRGKGGGYKLAKRPEEITAADILELTEESLSPVACLAPDAGTCPRSAGCRTLSLWRGLDKVIRDYLSGVTLAELAKPVGEGRAAASPDN